MMDCWHAAPDERPTFRDIRKRILRFLKTAEKKQFDTSDLNSSLKTNKPHTYFTLLDYVPQYVNSKSYDSSSQSSESADHQLAYINGVGTTNEAYSNVSESISQVELEETDTVTNGRAYEAIVGDRNDEDTDRESLYESTNM